MFFNCFYFVFMFQKKKTPLQGQFFHCFKNYGNQTRPINANVNFLMELFDQFGDPNGTPGVSYDQVFSSPWAAHMDIEEEHEKIVNDVMTWFDKIDDFDVSLILLLQLILLYNSDGIESQLKDLPKVQKLQSYYAKLLHKYLKSKLEDGVANSLFSRGIMFVHDTQRAFELSMQRLKLE